MRAYLLFAIMALIGGTLTVAGLMFFFPVFFIDELKEEWRQ
jgi:hypothetical protein